MLLLMVIEQAFRAGFREGVKLSLDRGVLRQMGIHCPTHFKTYTD